MLSIFKNEEERKTKSKVRAFYKSLLRACDKYDELKKSFDEIYNPINEQYQELTKIPDLIPRSSQTIIQNAFDSVDEVTGIADDFCSTIRGEFEPILKRLEISIKEIVNEIEIEQGQQEIPTTTDSGIITKTALQLVIPTSKSGVIITIVGFFVIVAVVFGGSNYVLQLDEEIYFDIKISDLIQGSPVLVNLTSKHNDNIFVKQIYYDIRVTQGKQIVLDEKGQYINNGFGTQITAPLPKDPSNERVCITGEFYIDSIFPFIQISYLDNKFEKCFLKNI